MADLYSTLFESFDPTRKLLTAVSCNLLDQLQALIQGGTGKVFINII